MASSIQVIALTNPAIEQSNRDFLGWSLIITVGVNVAINIIIVSRTVSYNSLTVLKENYEVACNWYNTYKNQNSDCFSPEINQENRQKNQDYEFCADWSNHRRWLIANGVEFHRFEEEIKFQELIAKYEYVQKANRVKYIKAA